MRIKKAMLINYMSIYLNKDHLNYKDLANSILIIGLDFAKELILRDTIWFSNDQLTEDDYPYILNLTLQLLEVWSHDDWYEIVRKSYHGKRILFPVVEINCEGTKSLLITNNT